MTEFDRPPEAVLHAMEDASDLPDAVAAAWDAADLTTRAKIVAAILTKHGHPVTSPDEATLDDVELARWNVCVEIVQALDENEH